MFKRRKQFGFMIVMLLMAALWISGCATSEVGKAYDVLYTGALVYDTALTYAGDEYRAGRLSEERKAEIIVYARQYKLALSAGQAALRSYKKAELLGEDLSDSEKALTLALDSVAEAQALLTQYIQLSSKGGDGL